MKLFKCYFFAFLSAFFCARGMNKQEYILLPNIIKLVSLSPLLKPIKSLEPAQVNQDDTVRKRRAEESLKEEQESKRKSSAQQSQSSETEKNLDIPQQIDISYFTENILDEIEDRENYVSLRINNNLSEEVNIKEVMQLIDIYFPNVKYLDLGLLQVELGDLEFLATLQLGKTLERICFKSKDEEAVERDEQNRDLSRIKPLLNDRSKFPSIKNFSYLGKSVKLFMAK